MKRTVMTIMALLWLCAVARAELPDDLPEFWFPVGEQLDYKLYWGIIPVGTARIESGWVQHDDGRWLVRLSMRARTGRFVSKIYPVRDRVESLVDPVTFLPVQYTQVLREGKKRRDDVFTFDYKAGVARVHDRRKDERYEVEVDTATRDILTFVYFMRSKGYAEGRKEEFRVLVEDKVYDLTLIGLKDVRIDLPKFGKLDALHLEPKAKFGEIFVRKGTVNAWFSNDERKLCAKMTGKVPVAKVKAVLVGVGGPGADEWPGSG